MSTSIATKAQEKEALDKIREIVAGLGKDSYVGTALKGCFEIAEENMEFDFLDSLYDRLALSKSISDDLIQQNKALAKETEDLKQKCEYFEQMFEKEQEWKEYEDKNNVKQSDYEKLANDGCTRILTDDEAKDLINEWFGFEKDKIRIIRNVPVYEINRHNYLRKTGTLERNPLYNATDWHYIRFDVCRTGYELYNDTLSLFVD